MKLSSPSAIALLVGLVGTAGCSDDDEGSRDLLLHVESPDWRDQVIYFIMIDRFDDAVASNNDQGEDEYDPTSNAHYSGGDLPGITRRLDYIQDLGATAIWITPPVANQWWDDKVNFGGYHGYWARNYKEVDEHYGTLDDYKRLSDALHRRGMYLIQDIVPNHTGNFFTWIDPADPDAVNPYDPENPKKNFTINQQSRPVLAPTQMPFELNDLLNAEHEAADIYHWTPEIQDFQDPVQEKTWAISDLDDLNTSNPVVRDALRDSFGYWIREVGVDGFRIDTAKFVEHEFWNDFIHSTDPAFPGVNAVAAATGRSDFLTFGEVFETSEPFDDRGERIATSYLGTEDAPEIGAVLGFPLYQEIAQIFAEGRPTRQMTYRLGKFMDRSLFRDPYITPNFIDNHDVRRFLSIASEDATKQALALLMTVPGIPIIYQGTGQGFTDTRRAMFGGGYLSDADMFDTNSVLFKYVRDLIAMRRANPALSRGQLEIIYDSATGPGPFAFRRKLGEEELLVVFNSADNPVVIPALPSGFAPGAQLEHLSTVGFSGRLEVGAGGDIFVELPPRAVVVVRDTGEVGTPPQPGAVFQVTSDLEGSTATTAVAVEGTVEPAETARVRLILNDNVDRAFPVVVDDDGSWTSTIDTINFPFGPSPQSIIVYSPVARAGTDRVNFTTNIPFEGITIDIDDPAGDDRGPDGVYTYPGAFSERNMDIASLKVEAAKKTLILTVSMVEPLSTIWSPPNKFDHVSFTTYFDLPDSEGVTFLPLVNGSTPDGFAWDLTHFAYGWDNAMYSSEGATEDEQGASISAAPLLDVDPVTHSVKFTFNADALGVGTWDDVRIWVTTWDFDGIGSEYRKLTPEGGLWECGGGDPSDQKVMDDVPPVNVGVIP